MMTWVSERSGSASSGMLRIDQKAMTSATTAAPMTTMRFSAEKRMIRLITLVPSVAGVRVGRRRGGRAAGRAAARRRRAAPRQRAQRRTQPRLGVDEEVGARHHLVAGGEAVDDLGVLPVAVADLDLARLELALADRAEDHGLGPRVEDR